MKRKIIFLTFKALPFFLLALLILSSLLISGCSPSDLIFGPSGSIEVDTYPPGAKIFLNGNDTGHITPYIIEDLVKGTYEITVTLGDLSYTEKVIVYSDITTSVYKDLLTRLSKIIVQPSSMNLEEGSSQTIDSITAYYFDSGVADIKLSACSYISNSNHATVNSVGTITGVSKGSAIITVSYTDVEITKTDTVNVNITTIPVEPPPTAVINVIPSTTGIVPFTVSFDASGSFVSEESGNSITSYSWDFGDGNTDMGIITTHTYSTIGLYSVILTIIDSNGKKDYATVAITVNEPGAPTAVISTIPDPPTGFAPLEIHFDACDSEADVDITSYNWDFGDGSTEGTGITINHTYTDVGLCIVVLTVTDLDGKKGYDTKVITVSGAEAPTAVITTVPDPPIGIAPFEVYFDAYDSSSETGIASYEWYFGDGYTGTGSEINHTYSNIGSYTVILGVTDNNGKKGYDNLEIIVTKKPTAKITTVPPAEEGVVTGASPFKVYFDAYGSTSESGIVNYRWDFGDGHTGTGITIYHIYTEKGSYITYLTVTDHNGYKGFDAITITAVSY